MKKMSKETVFSCVPVYNLQYDDLLDRVGIHIQIQKQRKCVHSVIKETHSQKNPDFQTRELETQRC